MNKKLENLDAFKDFEFSNKNLLACIGNNSGFQAFERDNIIANGFFDNVEIIIEQILLGKVFIDSIVYPFFYNSRHCIELLTKINIKIILEIYRIGKKIKSDSLTEQINSIMKTHDIGKLIDILETKLVDIDRRYPSILTEIQGIKELINDYFFDNGSDAFRYTYKKNDSQLNLDKQQLVSLDILFEKLKEFKKRVDYLYNCSCNICHEYYTGTHTKNLSRSDIEEISEKLPEYIHWKDENFKLLTEKILIQYSISKSEFDKSLIIIKNHIVFCNNIGFEIIYKSFSPNTFSNIAKLILNSNNPNKDESMAIIKSISILDQVLILTFWEIGNYNAYFAESLDSVYKHFNDLYIHENYFLSKFTKSFESSFFSGLKKCGQLTYISKLKTEIELLNLK